MSAIDDIVVKDGFIIDDHPLNLHWLRLNDDNVMQSIKTCWLAIDGFESKRLRQFRAMVSLDGIFRCFDGLCSLHVC